MQSRDINRKDVAKVRDANMYFFIEASIALLVSLVINVFVVAVFAHGLYGQTNNEIVCLNLNEPFGTRLKLKSNLFVRFYCELF